MEDFGLEECGVAAKLDEQGPTEATAQLTGDLLARRERGILLANPEIAA